MPMYRIADLLVDMPCTGERLVRQAAAYAVQTDAPPDLELYIPEETLAARVAQYPTLTRDDWEYILYTSVFYRELLRFDGLLLHASAVVVDGYAYLFSANSGVGKSTHTQLWRDLLGDRAYILNDDKPALRERDGRFLAYGTPFSGKTDLNRNACVPIGGICFLSRGEVNRVEPLAPGDAIPLLFEQTMRKLPADRMQLLLDRMDRLLQSAPLWKMTCNRDLSAAELAYETMRRGDAR